MNDVNDEMRDTLSDEDVNASSGNDASSNGAGEDYNSQEKYNLRASYNLPACLIIMDGFGLAEASEGNAISLADAPCLDYLLNYAPHVSLEASGEAVGLPAGQMGNSEVGHLNIGAGRVVPQELMRINRACEDGSFYDNEVLLGAFESVRENDSVLHLMGLLSDGGVHSNNEHLYALLRMARRVGVKRVFVHCFMDGRDVSPTSGLGYVEELQRIIRELCEDNNGSVASVGSGCDCGGVDKDDNNDDVSDSDNSDVSVHEDGFDVRIASISGRYYAMDRDNRWDRIERAYNAIVRGEPCVSACAKQVKPPLETPANSLARLVAKNPADFIRASYEAGVTDEFIEPVAFVDRGVQAGDAVVFFNFRPDRARQLTCAFIETATSNFDSECFVRDATPQVNFVCLTEYDATFDAPVAFPKTFTENVLADVLADAGLKQYHIAETEKYAHVTFFLNGGVEEPKAGERRKLISSPKVATYDLKPEMSAPEVADVLAIAIDADEADVYIVNFANCDMVGHTGSIPATISAVEAVDAGVAKVLGALERRGGVALVTADHGNADKMLDADGSPFTAHTTNPVPLVLVDYSGNNFSFTNVQDPHSTPNSQNNNLAISQTQGALCDIAPTLLDVIGINIPAEMTGSSLIESYVN